MAAKLLESSRLKLKSDLSKSLTSLLECPVCMEFMVTPIIQCLNGHNVCANCKPRLQVCPTCRIPLAVTSRNVALENIAESCFDGDGHTLQKKESTRNYRLYDCLAGKGHGCCWKGRRAELWGHVSLKHERLAICLKRNYQVFRVTRHDFSVSGSSTQLISARGQIFWYQFRQDSSKEKWFQAIQFIGPKREASDYKYTLEFGPVPQDSLKRHIVYTRVTHSDEENVDSIFKSADCFNIDLNTIKYFVTMNSSLEFKVKIEKT